MKNSGKFSVILSALFLVTGLLLATSSVFSQQVLLLAETFEGNVTNFDLNATGVGSNTGPNTWVINNQFSGNGIYPDTPNQDSTISGTINNAPFSKYLHIHDSSVAPGTANCNYNPNAPSDRFVVLNYGFCTLGLVDVEMSFFYIGEGSNDSYGEFYYSVNNGPWTKTGKPKYNNRSKWQYEVISNPAFNNVNDLRIGFRWVNGTDPTATVSFGIDDIFIVGEYDPLAAPVDIEVTFTSPNPVCQDNFLTIFYSLSGPLCDGMYSIELSNAVGNFFNPVNLGVFPIPANQTVGGIVARIPATVPPGNCYRVRVNRVSPPPAITGIASGCITVLNCPNIITTLQPPVTYGPDTLCISSAIDIPFTSTGVYGQNNIYTAQLSDSNGSFANPTTVGTLPSADSYDPALGSPPGNVSGLVPTVPPGCGYYLRITSSNPPVVPDSVIYFFGPFCIRECDVLTNNTQDISVCIMETVGVDTTITLDIHNWNNNLQYFSGNQFIVQLIDPMFYTVVNTGGIGAVFDTTSTTLTLQIPGLLQLLSMGLTAQMYYLRVLASNTNSGYDTLSTLIRLTIGAPADNPSQIIPSDTFICAGSLTNFLIDPYDPFNLDSDYEWLSNALNNGQPFIWDYNPLWVNWVPNTSPGIYTFYVREINNGCYGPWSDPVEVYVISNPPLNISGVNPFCQGDTIAFSVPFTPRTYYSWSSTWGTIVDTANNIIYMRFDSSGQVTISVNALNACGGRNNSATFTILPAPDNIPPLEALECPGKTITFGVGNPNSAWNYFWYLGDSLYATTDTIQFTAWETQDVVVSVTNSIGCRTTDTISVQIVPPPIANAGPDTSICSGTTLQLQATGGTGYKWDIHPSLSNVNIANPTASPDATTTYIVRVYEPVRFCYSIDTVTVTVLETLSRADSSAICPGDMAVLDAGFSALVYQWSNGETGQVIEVDLPGDYYVTARGADFACYNVNFRVFDSGCDLDVPNAFTPNNDGKNDFFTVFGVNMISYEISIFNRWGELVYQSADLSELNNKQRGWDGTFRGKPQNTGVYVYHIRGVRYDGKRYDLKGTLNLIR